MRLLETQDITLSKKAEVIRGGSILSLSGMWIIGLMNILPKGFVENYIMAGVAGPASYYLGLRLQRYRPGIAFTATVAGASAMEVGEKLDLANGVYDPKDFIAYAVGTLGGYLIDKTASKLK